MSKYIEVKDLSLDEWLELVFNPPEEKIFISVAFPTERHRKEYIDNIDKLSEVEVNRLLYYFLIKTGSVGPTDELRLQGMISAQRDAPELFKSMIERQYNKRLILNASGRKEVPIWEGITWIFDLLPHFPKQALEALNSYILAHAQALPDWRYSGLLDATVIIRAKYIGLPGTREKEVAFLYDLASRDFEYLVERLYDALGYDTELTPAQKDGGRDIKAKKTTVSNQEYLLVECKKYRNPVGVETVRALYGVISSEKVNKGVIVTTSRFTRGAQKFAAENPRLELISGDDLVGLMNEYLGPKWSLQVERYISDSKRKKETM